MRSPCAVGALLVASLLLGANRPLAGQQSAGEFPCDVRTADRIVAVGDVHGAFDQFVSILRAAGLIDQRNRWSGGKAVLVQTGDILDRGPDSRKALDLLRRLEDEARRDGGAVYALLGNHELMRLASDWRYVSKGEFEAFRTPSSEDLRKRALAASRTEDERQFLKQIPPGYLEMLGAFGEDGEYGTWLRARPAVARINRILFLHGGLTEMAASLGCDGVNAAVRKDVVSLPVPPSDMAALFAAGENGPLWYRGLANEPEAALSPRLDAILQRLDARAVVIGHTTVLPGKVAPRLGGKVIRIDTGMVAGRFYPGGVASALEIQGDKATAIYLDHREPLTLP